jgi:two-component system, NtrC family, sensor histidine kinase PilS
MDEKKYLRTEWVKIGFYSLLLIFISMSSILQTDFIQPDFNHGLLSLLTIAFIIHFFYIYFLKDILVINTIHYTVFIFDTIAITLLMFYFPSVQALFVFLYLVHILLAGLLFNKEGSIFIAVVSSFAFSLLLALGPQLEGQMLLLTIGLNNLGFFVVAFLSGTLGEQLKSLNFELSKKTKDLQVLKDLNSLILQNMQSGFISMDVKNSISLFNDAAGKILDKKLVEGTQLEFIFPQLSEKLQKSTNQQLDYNLKVKNGFKNLLILYSDIQQDGQKIGSMLVFSDQTNFRKLEDEKKRNEKLAAIGKLAAGIAHEIRNPLASMSGSIEFLRSSLQTATDEDKKLMQIVLREIDRLNGLVTDFLDFARPEQTLTELISLSQAANDTLQQLQNDQRFSKDVQIESNIEKSVEIIGDKNKLVQVIINLLINASQALQDSSIKRIQVEVKKQQTHILLRIKDSGLGMTEEVKSRLFEPFHTTKPKGTGLGLAVVHKILENHRATIEVISRPGEGADFLIRFPLP